MPQYQVSVSDAAEQAAEKPHLEKILCAVRKGMQLPTEEQYAGSATAKRYSYREFQDLYEEAKAVIKAERKTAMAKRRQKLKDEDTSLRVPEAQLDAMERTLRDYLDDDDLDAFNAELIARKSGSLTHRDIAFIACVHRDSVLTNGRNGEQFAGTSPFTRIASASTAVNYRTTPFDNRQIRYALSILETAGFTSETGCAVRGQGRGKNKAGTWTITESLPWSAIFL